MIGYIHKDIGAEFSFFNERKQRIKKKEVNIYTFNNLQVTINSPEELKNAKLNYKKYFTLNEKTKK